MNLKRYLLVIICFFTGISFVNSQSLINGDLEHPYTIYFGTYMGILTGGWRMIRSDDPVQLMGLNDSPDILGKSGPSPNNGIYGYPQSGNTFVSGVMDLSHHEGLKQLVEGFTPGKAYSISFYQSVVKSFFSLDTSGSWAVYMDTTLIGISTPTISHDSSDHKSLTWEFRTFTFIPSDTSHWLKFIPADDDADFSSSLSGSLRMGIDNINLDLATGVKNETTSSNIICYPNPANDLFTIQTANNETGIIHIFNSTGQLVLTKQMNGDGQINVSHLNEGIYFIKCIGKDFHSTKKIVISR